MNVVIFNYNAVESPEDMKRKDTIADLEVLKIGLSLEQIREKENCINFKKH